MIAVAAWQDAGVHRRAPEPRPAETEIIKKKGITSMKKKMIALLLALIMVIGLLPMGAMADGTPTITLNTNIRSANYTTSPYLTFTGSGATSQSARTFNQLTSNLAVVEGNQYIIKLNNYAAPASNAMDADYLRMDSLRINGTAITVPETETALPEIEGVAGTVNLANGAIVITMDAPTVDVTVDFSFIIETAKLQALIDQAEEIRNSDLYYSDGDYYNGYEYSNTGAWQNVFGTWGKLTSAKNAISRNDLSVSEIKMCAEDLTTALNALVPKTQMNLGSLYSVFKKDANVLRVGDDKDKVDGLINYPDDYFNDRYTRASWNACRAAFLEAFDYLNTLFTDRNTENAKPTEANKPENQLIADSYAKKLQMAYDGRMYAGEEETYYAQAAANLTSLQAAVNGFKVLAAGLDEADYTPASWTVFQSAMTALNNVQLPAAVTTDEEYGAYVNVKNAYNLAYNTYYFTLTPAAQEITVHFRTMDPARARTADMKLFPGVLEYMYAPVEAGFCGTVTLSGAYTLADLAAAAGISMPAERGYWNVTYVGLFINGIYVTGDYVNPQTYDPNASDGRSYYYPLSGCTYTSDFKHVKLHPGDEVTLVYTPMTYSKQSPTIAFQDALLSQYMDDIRYEAFTAETIEVEAGETATVTITQTPASMLSSGSAAPAEGLQLYISEKQESSGVNAPAKTIMLSGGEKIITDENGQADIRLYEEGWYLIAAYDTQEDIMGDQNQDTLAVTPGTYYSANSGAVAWVHVTAPADPTGVKKDLKDELTDAAAEYPEIIFRASDWQTIQTTVDDALTAIDEAETVVAAYSAQQTAMTAIRKIQNSTVSANTNKPAQFRTDLAKLPTDLNELTLGQQSIVNSLINCYESMSDYQKSLLTAKELSAYAAIAEKNEAGLPDAKEYALNVEVVADTAEATAIVQAMTAYLQENAPKEDQVGSMEPNTLNTFCAFSPLKGFNDITSAAPLKQVQVFTNVDYAAYLLTRGADGHTISGDGWSISDNDDLTLEVKTGKNMSYDVIGHLTVMIDGIAYEIKSITFDGIDDQAVRSNENSFYDHSSYKGKDPESVNMYFANAYQTFTVPYNDVTATVTWGPVFENSPVGHLDAVYAGYSKAEYSSENWNALTKAYLDGRVAAVNAADDAAAAEACDAAIAAMAAIVKKDAADYGTVTVIVENTTYAAEDGAPWDGVLVDTTVALNEDSTMMSAVVDALTAKGYTQTGAESNYISEINGLSEFDGGSDSGWMGTLNDWFNNEGFAAFTVAEGKLADGDVIRIMYTCDYGADIGGTWNNSDTSLKTLTVSTGTLTPDFSSGVTEYTLILDSETANVKLSYEAVNKNYQARTYLNNYNVDSSYYKQSETLGVKDGDVIYVGVGERGWASMNDSGIPTKYVIRVKTLDSALDALPDASVVTMSNYKDYQALVETYKAKLNGASNEKLDALEQRVIFFAEIDNVRTLLAALPGADKLTENNKTDAQEAVEAYEALSDAQLDYFTVGEAGKYAAVKAWLDDMAAAAAAKAEADKKAAVEVEKLIDAIGEVTLDDEEAIKDAREAYNALTDEQKALVNNYGTLVAAEETLANLKDDALVTGFKDVEAGSYYEDAVKWAVAHNITQGTSATTFSPDRECTRGEIVTFLWRAAGSPEPTETACPFKDVKADAYYGKAVLWAVEQGITTGTSATAFSPDMSCGRDQIVTFLWRANGKPQVSVANPFVDVASNAYYYNAVLWAVDKGITSGVDKTHFAPARICTRAEIVTFLYRGSK